jgi:8-oxo-dGTP pyrophosphatase MutT (NUDIX family)
VDDEDKASAARLPAANGASRFPDLTASEEQAYRVAAVRELEEEAGVRVQPADLEPIAHWVTPEIESRRYDTRFFLTRMPDGQEARHDAGETTEFMWMSPAVAIDRCRRGEIMLPPPTWTTLRRLDAFAALEDVFAWARHKPIARVQPNLIRGEQTMLTLPGDPTYPTVEGWEIPEDTRFVLDNGRWQPTEPVSPKQLPDRSSEGAP